MENDLQDAIFDKYYELIALVRTVFPENSSISPDFKKISAFYESKGYLVINLPEKSLATLLAFFSIGAARQFDVDDYSTDYIASSLPADTVSTLNQKFDYFGPPDRNVSQNLLNLLTLLRPYVEAAMGPFEVQNIRAWTTKPEAGRFGPTDLHSDGMSKYVRKLMIYPYAPNIENGTIEIVGRDNIPITLNIQHGPTAVLADVSYLMHRGVPPKTHTSRPAIEVTLTPSLRTQITATYAGQNARIRRLRAQDFEAIGIAVEKRHDEPARQISLSSNQSKEFSERRVNIGGGPKFNHSDWTNYDFASNSTRTKLSFTPFRRLPHQEKRADLVYTSHCLEHLPDETVNHLLSEIHRISSDDAKLVVKLPDFTRVLHEYKHNISDGILNPDLWNLRSLYPIWRQYGIEASLENIAAMILCGYWNSFYGDEFSLGRSKTSSAYHGPPKIDRRRLRDILLCSDSPHFIASILRAEVKRLEDDRVFNHQNAWSREEFNALARLHGFATITPRDHVISQLQIPTINEMREISAYYIFQKI
jgi:predicted SAM-dependent methyltransferase